MFSYGLVQLLTKQAEYIQLHEQHNDSEQQSDDHQCNTDNSQVNSDEL